MRKKIKPIDTVIAIIDGIKASHIKERSDGFFSVIHNNLEWHSKSIQYCEDLIIIFKKKKYTNLFYFQIIEILFEVSRNRDTGRHAEDVLDAIRNKLAKDNLDELRLAENFGGLKIFGDNYKEASKNLSKAALLLNKEVGGGPEQCREEVTGLSTSGKNKNMSNSGFGGGIMARLAAA